MSTSTGLSLLDNSLAIPEVRLKRKEAVLQELVGRLREAGALGDADLLLDVLLMRERLGSTAMGKGVALPNARSIAVTEPRLVVARSSRGVEWRAPDDLPVHLVFLVLSPAEWSIDMHHDQLSRAAGFARLQRNRQRLIDAPNATSMSALVREIGS